MERIFSAERQDCPFAGKQTGGLFYALHLINAVPMLYNNHDL
jgi:hypothetical protein